MTAALGRNSVAYRADEGLSVEPVRETPIEKTERGSAAEELIPIGYKWSSWGNRGAYIAENTRT